MCRGMALNKWAPGQPAGVDRPTRPPPREQRVQRTSTFSRSFRRDARQAKPLQAAAAGGIMGCCMLLAVAWWVGWCLSLAAPPSHSRRRRSFGWIFLDKSFVLHACFRKTGLEWSCYKTQAGFLDACDQVGARPASQPVSTDQTAARVSRPEFNGRRSHVHFIVTPGKPSRCRLLLLGGSWDAACCLPLRGGSGGVASPLHIHGAAEVLDGSSLFV